jgi:hypothetical protein
VSTNGLTCTTPAINGLTTTQKVHSFGITACSELFGVSGYLHPNLAQFTFTQPPIVTGVIPSRGIISGNTLVTIIGTNFLHHKNDPTTLCRFGSVGDVEGKFISDTMIECLTPAGVVGTADLMREVQEVVVASLTTEIEVQKISIVGTKLNQEVQRLHVRAIGEDSGTGKVAQTIRVMPRAGMSLGGTFRLELNGKFTSWFSIDASAEDVKEGIETFLLDEVRVTKKVDPIDYDVSGDSRVFDIELISVPGGLSPISSLIWFHH